MPLSSLKVLELNEKYNLVSGLCKRELENPEGCGLDLRVGRVEKLVGDSFLGIDKDDEPNRYSPKIELVGDINEDGNKLIVLKPGDYYLVQTMETITSPPEKVRYEDWWKFWVSKKYLMPVIFPRSSLQRGGVSFHATKTDPGYSGKLTFGMANLGNIPFRFQLGARMFNVVFEPVIGNIKRSYNGQHQGGRTTSQGEKEKQN